MVVENGPVQDFPGIKKGFLNRVRVLHNPCDGGFAARQADFFLRTQHNAAGRSVRSPSTAT